MSDAGFISIKQLFSEIAGEYANGSQLIDRLVEAQGRHVTELPIIGVPRLLEIGRDRGWIKADNKRVVVAVPEADLS